MLLTRRILIPVIMMALFAGGCDITFKRKSTGSDTSDTRSAGQKSSQPKAAPVSKEAGRHFSSADKKLITQFFTSAANEQLLRDNYELTRTSDDLRKEIRSGSRLPANIQLLPLPLALEGRLTPTRGSLIRIQVEYNIILLDIRSRIIMDMFNLKP